MGEQNEKSGESERQNPHPWRKCNQQHGKQGQV